MVIVLWKITQKVKTITGPNDIFGYKHKNFDQTDKKWREFYVGHSENRIFSYLRITICLCQAPIKE